jgi:hypothetical protein
VSKSSMSIAPGVIVENVGDDVVVMLPESTEVIRLSGDAAQLVRAIHAGDVSVLPSHTVTELLERGILISQAGMSRRGVLTAGAIGASAGLAALSMPTVAAAASAPVLFGTLVQAANGWDPVADQNSTGLISAFSPEAGDIAFRLSVLDPPYDPGNVPSPAVIGTVRIGTENFEFKLVAPAAGAPAAWFLSVAPGDAPEGFQTTTGSLVTITDFEMTFSFDGAPYRVVPTLT